MVENALCTWCNEYVETYSHFFYDCHLLDPLWSHIKNKYNTDKAGMFTTWNVITNLVHPKPGNVLNLICLITKQILYRERCMTKKIPRCSQIDKEVNQIKLSEYYIASSKRKLRKHAEKWSNFYSEQELQTMLLDDNHVENENIIDYINDY